MIINANNGAGVTPIEEGGTGARTARQARKNLGVTEIHLLYSDDATTGISQQTIKLPQMMDYDYLELVIKVSTTDNTFFTEKLPCIDGARIQATFVSSVPSPDINFIANTRFISIDSSTTLKVNPAYQKGAATLNYVEVPTILLPYEIYGVKVQ